MENDSDVGYKILIKKREDKLLVMHDQLSASALFTFVWYLHIFKGTAFY